jgi:cell division septal protein FtsQ
VNVAARRVLRSPWAWAALFVLLTAGLVATLRFAPVFRVHHVDVVGNSQVSAEEVVSAAQVSDTAALLALPVDDIESRVESLDAVAGARVVRDWPNRVRIVIRERRPIGYVINPNTLLIVGSDGSLYRELSKAPRDVPELRAAGPTTFDLGGDYLSGAGETQQAVFEVAAGLPVKLQRAITQVAATGPRTVQLRFADGVVVDWGTAGAASQKTAVVEALRERGGWGSRFTVVDVSAPEAPAWR